MTNITQLQLHSFVVFHQMIKLSLKKHSFRYLFGLIIFLPYRSSIKDYVYPYVSVSASMGVPPCPAPHFPQRILQEHTYRATSNLTECPISVVIIVQRAITNHSRDEWVFMLQGTSLALYKNGRQSI